MNKLDLYNDCVLKFSESISQKLSNFFGRSNVNLFISWGLAPIKSIDDTREAFFYEFSQGKKLFSIIFFESGYFDLSEYLINEKSKIILYCHCIDSKQIFFIEEMLLNNIKLGSNIHLENVDYGLCDI